MTELSIEAQQKLESDKNIWFASVRPDGRPHLAPIWFAWYAGKLYVCIEPQSVKGRNIAQNPRIVLALENGSNPVICEGNAVPLSNPWPEKVLSIFQKKYEWDLKQETRYTQLVEITPHKWLVW